MALTAEGVSEEVTDTQSDAAGLGVVLTRDFGFADTDGTVHEGTLAQAVSVGQTTPLCLLLLARLNSSRR